MTNFFKDKREMIVFLVGYMGCGKSTLGRQMARDMGYEFLDTDEMLEKLEGATVSDIFARKGEKAFRVMEHDAIGSLEGKDKVVVSTGGGLPCFCDNMALMNEIGFTVYLDVPIDTLISRVEKTGAKRPLIAQKSDQELEEFVRASVLTREPFYKQAKMTVSGRSVRASDIIQLINIQKN